MGRRPRSVAVGPINKTTNQMTQNQNITITKALVKDLGEGDKININYAPIMIVHKEAEKVEAPLDNIQELMWTILESLPPPKMENLRKLAMKTCISKIKGTNKIAEYFDFQRTYISRLKWELKIDPIFGDIEQLALSEPEEEL